VATARRLAKSTSGVCRHAGLRVGHLAALATAGLVLEPVQASPLDVAVMIDTARPLSPMSTAAFPFSCDMMQTPAIGRLAAKSQRMTEAGFPLGKRTGQPYCLGEAACRPTPC
jgi:hypothetical protein